jgi:hypothetical protein
MQHFCSMKTGILLFILFIILNNLFAQSKQLKIPEVKESPIIDSVLARNIAQVIPAKSCILLDIGGGYFMYHLYVSLIKTGLSVINLYDHDLNNNLRFLNYKGHLIFVIGPDDPFHFFTKTNNKRIFSFKNNLIKQASGNTYGSNKNDIYIDVYEYKNGRFETLLVPIH